MKFLGLEVGSWADWVSGIGSLLAVVFVIVQMKRDKKMIRNSELKATLELISNKRAEARNCTFYFIEELAYREGDQKKVSFETNKFINEMSQFISEMFKLVSNLEEKKLVAELLIANHRINEYLIKIYEIEDFFENKKEILNHVGEINRNLSRIDKLLLNYHIENYK